MRFVLFRAVAASAVLAISLAGGALASTPPASVYHGVWDGASVCGEHFVDSGIWNVNLKGDGTAEVSARIFKEGRPHAAWGGNYFWQPWVQMPVGNAVFVLHNDYGLDFVLGLDGVLTYTLEGFCDDGSDALLYGHVLP